MKVLLPFAVLAVALLASAKTDNALRNTKWEDANGLVVYFTASDTVKLLQDNKLLAAAQYTIKDSVITWRDFVVSPANCDTSIRGRYVYSIKDSLLSFRFLSDRCEERANFIQTLVLARY